MPTARRRGADPTNVLTLNMFTFQIIRRQQYRRVVNAIHTARLLLTVEWSQRCELGIMSSDELTRRLRM